MKQTKDYLQPPEKLIDFICEESRKNNYTEMTSSMELALTGIRQSDVKYMTMLADRLEKEKRQSQNK